jgi:flavin-dependent dehydrogenase
MGPGYWVWVIPLDNGATSIGIVMDDQAFSDGDFSTVDTTMDWLRQHHPRCADALDGADVLDYVVINDYSHSCKQMFSDQGWGVTGESGVFADPFYSPGSDFIAFNNTFINDLITDDFAGNDIRLKSRVYHAMNQSLFDSSL